MLFRSKYGNYRFEELLNSEIEIAYNDYNEIEFIDIHCNDYRLGEDFFMAAAGYISTEEFVSLFNEEN